MNDQLTPEEIAYVRSGREFPAYFFTVLTLIAGYGGALLIAVLMVMGAMK